MYSGTSAHKSRSLMQNVNSSKSKFSLEAKPSRKTFRGTVNSSIATNVGISGLNRGPRKLQSSNTSEPPKKSVYMERRQAIPLRKAVLRSTETLLPTTVARKSESNGSILASVSGKTKTTVATASAVSTTTASPKTSQKLIKKKSELKENEKKVQTIEFGIQTMEAEIQNFELIIGDIKVMSPSPALVYQIDAERRMAKQRALMQTTRKFTPSEKKYEKHLDNLREFLERGAITKRAKIIDALEVDRSCMRTMDEIMSRQIPRTESITNIKDRINIKENELLSMLDCVNNLNLENEKQIFNRIAVDEDKFSRASEENKVAKASNLIDVDVVVGNDNNLEVVDVTSEESDVD